LLTLQLSTRTLVLALLAAASALVLMRLWPVVLLILTALIFMAALQPYVAWLERHRLPRIVAVLMIFALILAAIAGLAALVVPAMVDEFRDLQDTLPEDARRMEDFLANFGIDVELEERARDVDWGELISGRQAVDYGQRAFEWIFATFSVLVLTIYLLIDSPRLQRFMYQFVPAGREPEVERVLLALSRVVGGCVRAQFITSIAIGAFTFVVLSAVGVPNAVAFAVLAAFADIIPVFGAYIATIPPVVAAFDVSTTRAVIVLVALLLYQQFEDRYLTPAVYGRSLNLPPLIVLIAVLIGGELLGIAGILLALPAAAVARVALDYYMDRRSAAPLPSGPVGEPVAPDAREGGS
jgi:predicted PurR-regulated permease PerM